MKHSEEIYLGGDGDNNILLYRTRYIPNVIPGSFLFIQRRISIAYVCMYVCMYWNPPPLPPPRRKIIDVFMVRA